MLLIGFLWVVSIHNGKFCVDWPFSSWQQFENCRKKTVDHVEKKNFFIINSWLKAKVHNTSKSHKFCRKKIIGSQMFWLPTNCFYCFTKIKIKLEENDYVLTSLSNFSDISLFCEHVTSIAMRGQNNLRSLLSQER